MGDKMKKICKECKRKLPVECFTRSKMVKDGYENKCKECRQKARHKYENVCITCGTTFKSINPEAKYCSQKCKPQCSKIERVTVKCCVCGKEKKVTPHYRDSHDYFYCSRKCSSIGETGRRTGKDNPRYSQKEIVCENCGKMFFRIESQIDQYKHNYCSVECKNEGFKILFLKENNPMYGKERRDMHGANNWAWNPSRTYLERQSERKLMENKRWRRDVFHRDDYTCKICGKRGGGNIVAHHLDSYDWCKEKRFDVENGIVLCEDCHKNFHRLYGYGKNTRNQFYEYQKGYANTEPSSEEIC